MADCDSIFDLPFFIGTLLPNTGRPYYVAECFNSVEKSANYEEACHCKDKGEEGPAMFYIMEIESNLVAYMSMKSIGSLLLQSFQLTDRWLGRGYS